MTPALTPAVTPFTAVDYFVMLIFAVSILLGYMRGFLKEVISLLTLVAATIISTMFSGKLAAIFSGSAGESASSTVSNATGMDVSHSVSLLSIGASYVTLFLGTMLAGWIIGTIVTGVANNAGASLMNRFLGALFGGIRGFIFVILFMFIAELTPMGEQVAWVTSSFVKSFQPVVSWIQKEVGPTLDKVRKQAETTIEGATSQMGDVQGMFNGVTGGAAAAAPDNN
jgi:membrane protein required for colicin V production